MGVDFIEGSQDSSLQIIWGKLIFIILLWWKIEMADRYREYDGVMRWWRLNTEMMNDKMKDKMMVNENGDDAWQDEWEMTLSRILVDDCDFDGHDDRWTCCDETGCLGWYMYTLCVNVEV